MKVKVGNQVFNSNVEPIMIMLEPKEKDNIRYMPEGVLNYVGYPKDIDESMIREWMQV